MISKDSLLVVAKACENRIATQLVFILHYIHTNLFKFINLIGKFINVLNIEVFEDRHVSDLNYIYF